MGFSSVVVRGWGWRAQAGDDLYQRGPKRFKKSPFDVITGDPRRNAALGAGGLVGVNSRYHLKIQQIINFQVVTLGNNYMILNFR